MFGSIDKSKASSKYNLYIEVDVAMMRSWIT